MNTLLCIYTVLKLFSLPSVTMTLQSRILNRYRFIWAFWLTFQIYSLNTKFSFSVTAIPHSYHGVLALSIYHFSCSLMQMGKSQQEWWKVHRHLLLSKKKKKSIYFIGTGPPTLGSSEIIGDVRLYVAQHSTMSKQPALRINNHTGQMWLEAMQKGPLWRNRRLTCTYKAYQCFRQGTGGNY